MRALRTAFAMVIEELILGVARRCEVFVGARRLGSAQKGR